MSAARSVRALSRDPRTPAMKLYGRITWAERQFRDHMDEWNVDYVPVDKLINAEPLLAVALANLEVALQCIEAVRKVTK